MWMQKSNAAQTLRAVTIRQIFRDNSNTEDESFKVDNVEITTVSVLRTVKLGVAGACSDVVLV